MKYSEAGNMSNFNSELVQDKPFLYDVKDRMHSNRDITVKALECTEMVGEGNYYLIM